MPPTQPTQPTQLTLPLPSTGLKLHIHLTNLSSTLLLFLTSTGLDEIPTTPPMGPLTYSMPNKYNTNEPLSTRIYPGGGDFATRLAKVLVRRTGKLCFVGGGVDFPLGRASVEEEIAVLRAVVGVVCERVER
ncbi:hypothetical protein K470DRAFT_254248 [Piedraia hortae CBS 480.64]|uniref:Uncharacterized protein n=1 Tax=Piedraia hortae CBS 480.64 TaxID=1314780 RepID=A0A6A7CBN4_9PEZI|nr:hypothetical protein K470DRAFT_254248 [Piedraia hortae CBS 480.64]